MASWATPGASQRPAGEGPSRGSHGGVTPPRPAENKGAGSPGRKSHGWCWQRICKAREGEKRGKTSFGNVEERFLEPNSLKKKNPRSGWQPRNIFIFGFSSRLYKLAWSVPVRVCDFVQLGSDSPASWMPCTWQDGGALLFVPRTLGERLLCAGCGSE